MLQQYIAGGRVALVGRRKKHLLELLAVSRSCSIDGHHINRARCPGRLIDAGRAGEVRPRWSADKRIVMIRAEVARGWGRRWRGRIHRGLGPKVLDHDI